MLPFSESGCRLMAPVRKSTPQKLCGSLPRNSACVRDWYLGKYSESTETFPGWEGTVPEKLRFVGGGRVEGRRKSFTQEILSHSHK